MPPTNCGADQLANDLLTSLTAGVNFDVPDVDLSGPEFSTPESDLDDPVSLTIADLTTGVVGGTGVFDVVMKSLRAHIKEEFDASRLTGGEYTKAWGSMIQAALGNSVQFLLGRDQAYWQAVAAQMQAKIAAAQVVTARVNLETAKVQLSIGILEARNQEATYALTKMKLSTESIGFCSAEYQLVNLLPIQKKVLEENHETARAQTMETRSDNVTPITGAMGKQKELYNQQIASYQRDAEIKAAKLFTDAWITQKTIDEGLLPPTEFANASLDTILGHIKTNNDLD